MRTESSERQEKSLRDALRKLGFREVSIVEQSPHYWDIWCDGKRGNVGIDWSFIGAPYFSIRINGSVHNIMVM